MSDVHKLGPMWVKEIVSGAQKQRDKLAANLDRLKPDGDYAAQHRMALDVLDRMLEAARRAVPAQTSAAEVVAWMTEDGRVATDRTKRTAMAKQSAVNFNIPLCRADAAPVPAQDEPRKTKGSQWHGRVVGQYATELTPEGYAVESSTERGSVQIYPAAALELVSACQSSAINERTD